MVIVARDEEHKIARTVRSARWAEELLVVDTGSLDRTREIAQNEGAIVCDHHWEGFSRTKQWAIDQCKNDWVLLIDADEVIPEALALEIRQMLSEVSEGVNGFSCPRKNYFLGKWMRWGGWYPDRVIRLFRKGHGKLTPVRAHESIRVDGVVNRLCTPLEHYTVENLTEYLNNLNRATTLGAMDLADKGRRCHWWDLSIRPFWMFLRMTVFKFGILDGGLGLLLAVLSAYNVLIKYAKLRGGKANLQ